MDFVTWKHEYIVGFCIVQYHSVQHYPGRYLIADVLMTQESSVLGALCSEVLEQISGCTVVSLTTVA